MSQDPSTSKQRGDLEAFASSLVSKIETSLARKLDAAHAGIESRLSKLESRASQPGNINSHGHQETPTEEAIHLNDYGVQLYYRNQLDQAAQALEDALEVQPDLTEAWNNLGVVYTGLNRPEKAIAAFQKAAECDPQRTDYLNNQGVLALLEAKPEKALELFEEAVVSKDREVAVLLNLAQAYLALSFHGRAVQAWKMVLTIDPHQVEATQNLRQYYT